MPKIHKQGSSLRIIISSKNSPLYELATFLHDTMHGSIPSSNKQISNSYQLVDRLTNTYIQDEFKLISLDVVSLFTNVPIDVAVNSVIKRWIYIERNCSILRDEFLTAVRFVLDFTFFAFNGIFY